MNFFELSHFSRNLSKSFINTTDFYATLYFSACFSKNRTPTTTHFSSRKHVRDDFQTNISCKCHQLSNKFFFNVQKDLLFQILFHPVFKRHMPSLAAQCLAAVGQRGLAATQLHFFRRAAFAFSSSAASVT